MTNDPDLERDEKIALENDEILQEAKEEETCQECGRTIADCICWSETNDDSE